MRQSIFRRPAPWITLGGLALGAVVALSACLDEGEEAQLESQQHAATILYPAIDFAARPSYLANNVIGLSFDDGPDLANTPRVLDVLKAKNAKATFFINTNNFDGPVDSNTNLKNTIKRIVNEGHQLGSHTVEHLHLGSLSPAQIEAQVVGVQTTVNRADVLGPAYPKITLLRAPFGEPYQGGAPGQAAYDKVGAVVGKYAVHVGWAIDTVDYNCTGTVAQKKACVVNAFKNAVKTPGTGSYGQVLMHSVQPQTADAIGDIIDYCRNSGFVFMGAEEMVVAKYGKSSHELIYGGTTPPPVCNQAAYGGTARAIPGTIQAEDYDTGGQNCAFNDTTTANQGGQYRTSEAVDVQVTTDTGGGYNIGYVIAGEYLEYTVNVATAGNYKLELRAATTAAGKNVDVLMGTTMLADNLAITNTGNYQTFATVSVPSVALAAGTQVLKVLFNQSSMNLNWIKLTALATCTPETDAAFCSRLGKNCGSVSGTDNCGTPRTAGSCGTCSAPASCGGTGTPNVCGVACVPETDAAFCGRLGKNCGSVSGTDNCGTPRTAGSCGTCAAPASCGGAGTPNVCGTCTPETDAAFCARLGKNCGSVSGTDNCGATRTASSCGTCTAPSTCNASNVCTSALGITNLIVNDTTPGNDAIANNTQWSVQASFGGGSGQRSHGDRTNTIDALTGTALTRLAGKPWIRTAADSKTYAATSPPLATATITGSFLNLAVDSRHATTFLTSAGFTSQGFAITVREGTTPRTYNVWRKAITSGSTVTLPAIGASTAACYIAIIE